MKVYVIEKGYYSDRHIIGVVETKEEAEEICGILRNTTAYDNDSTSYEEFDTKQIQTNQFRFIVRVYSNGHWDVEYDDYGYYDNYKESCCCFEDCYVVYAKTPQQAIKIAQDMDAEIKAKINGIA